MDLLRIQRLFFCTLFSISFTVLGCEKTQETSSHSDKIKVVASIFPLADFVRNVGGERVDVVTLLPPAASPHVYSPAPRDLVRIQGAGLFIKIGLGFEFWAEDLARSGAGKGLMEVETSRGVEVIQESEHGHEHGHKVGNPHIWLDPVIAMEQVKQIKEALMHIDPSHGEEYNRNAEDYLEKLEQLDLDIRETIMDFSQRSFVAFHPSWAYFARRYGLVEAGIIEAAPGREPTPGEIMAITKQAREAGIKVVFGEPQLNPKAAYVVADEIGGKVLFLDPIGSPEQEDRSTYLKLMRYNLGIMKQGMGNG